MDIIKLLILSEFVLTILGRIPGCSSCLTVWKGETVVRDPALLLPSSLAFGKLLFPTHFLVLNIKLIG